MEEKKVLCLLYRSVKQISFEKIYHFQNAGIKQGREKEKLKISHDKQTEELLKDIQKVLRAPPHPTSTHITSIETVL